MDQEDLIVSIFHAGSGKWPAVWGACFSCHQHGWGAHSGGGSVPRATGCCHREGEECLLTASAAWARRVTGEGLQGDRGETHRAHFPVESGEQTRGKHQGSRVRGQGICAWPGERLPLVARRDWFLGSSGNSRRFSSDSPTTVRLWPLEIRLLCVGLRQESRGRGRSQRATPTHHKGSRPLRGGEWEVLVEGWTGRPRPDPGDGCRALSCLPGELWRVPR